MVERYIKEYASACKKKLKEYPEVCEEYKNQVVAKIDKTVNLRNRGLITADEAIKIILERFE